MKRHSNPQLKLADLIRIVSRFARNDYEVGLVVADLLNRGLVRVNAGHRRHRVVVR